MPLYDFRCKECDWIFERFARQDERVVACEKCSSTEAHRIVSLGSSAYRTDATWLEGVLEVVDKDDKNPATLAFRAEPSRQNYHAWMKAKGLRPMEENEFRNPFKERAIERANIARTHLLLKQKRQRETIHVRRS